MLKKGKLIQFYIAEYQESAKKKKAEGKATYQDKIPGLLMEMKSIRSAKINPVRLEDYHRRIRNIAYFAFREQNRMAVMQVRDQLIPELVRLDMLSLKEGEQELLSERFLEYLHREAPMEICSKSLKTMCRQYSEVGVKGQILDLVPTRPEMEFQEALQMERHFILHIGPTNCGKTYRALERLQQAENGVYLGPLRLLALEVYEKMKDLEIPCTMLTGEECIWEDHARVISSTIEMLDLDRSYDVAVIDEAQMVADEERGHSWTRAILGVQAKEIHVCMSPAAQQVVLHLIGLTNSTYEIHTYERMTRLVCEKEPFNFPEDVHGRRNQLLENYQEK